MAGYRLHQPVTTDAPGLIEFLDANRTTIGKMTSSTVRSGTSVSTTMTVEGLGNATPIAVTDETVGDGALTRVTIQRGAETTTYEQDAAGIFLIAGGGRIPVDDEHEAELSAALSAAPAPLSADARFRIFAMLSQDPKLPQPPELKGMFFNHKSPLCTYVLGTALAACVSSCLAALAPNPITWAACVVSCGAAVVDVAYCQYQASIAVNDAQCNASAPPGYTGHADATEHQCINQCDTSLCDSYCRSQPNYKSSSCSGNACVCWQSDEVDDGTGGGGGFVAVLPFLPPALWRDRGAAACSGGSSPRALRALHAVCLICLAGLLVDDVATVAPSARPPRPVAAALAAVGLDHRWDMFAPHPPSTRDELFVRVDGDASRDVALRPANVRWRKYFEHVVRDADPRALLRHLCGTTGAHRVALHRLVYPIPAPGRAAAPPDQRRIAEHTCAPSAPEFLAHADRP